MSKPPMPVKNEAAEYADRLMGAEFVSDVWWFESLVA